MSDFSLSGYVTGTFPELVRAWNDTGRTNIQWEDVVAEEKLNDSTIQYTLVKLCWANHRIWHHEDPCRSGIPELIVANKPQIDVHNQIRNDLIERVDEWVVCSLQGSKAGAPGKIVYNTETLGSVVDRFSILELKVYHTGKMAEAGNEKAEKRMPRLLQQHGWLAMQFAELVLDVQHGRRLTQVFRQFKTYNDPDLNAQHKDHKK